MDKEVGVIVDFNGSHIGVFSMANSDGVEALRGELMLVTNFILRVMSLSKPTDAKSFYLAHLTDGLDALPILISNFFDGYEAFYKVDSINFEHKLAPKSERKFSFMMPYADSGHTTRFKPQGFGILGKNIEASSMLASLLLIDFLMTKYEKKSQVLKILDSVVKDCAQLSNENGKISAKLEWHLTEEIAKKHLSATKQV